MKYVMRWVRFCVLVGMSLLALGCQKSPYDDLPDPSSNAVSVTSDYPAVVKVLIPGGGLCTGTFVSRRAVLTASHCTQKAGTYTVQSSFGSFQTTTRVNYGPGVVDDPRDISFLIFNRDVASLQNTYGIGGGTSRGEILRLIGFGCNDLDTRRGTGVKRTGTNMVAQVTDYIEFLTPPTDGSNRRITGPSNRAGSCFGDSGGPAAETREGKWYVKGVAHAGGPIDEGDLSEYADLGRGDNRAFISSVNRDYDLQIDGF